MALSPTQKAAGEKIAASLSDTVAGRVVSTGNDQIQKIAKKVDKIVDPNPRWYSNHLLHLIGTSAATTLLILSLQSSGSKKSTYVPSTAPKAPTEAKADAGKAFDSASSAGSSAFSMEYLARASTNAPVQYVTAAQVLSGMTREGLSAKLKHIGAAKMDDKSPVLVFSKNATPDNGRAFIIDPKALEGAALANAVLAVEVAVEDIAKKTGETNKIAYRISVTDGKVDVTRDINGDKKKTGPGDMESLAVFAPPGP